MATSLFTPILNDRTRAPYFFNGRLLTGETMTAEQRAQHVAHELLAQGLGDGVAHGLQVDVSTAFNTIDRPVVTVKAGVAISRRGDLLLLSEDTPVELVRPATASVALGPPSAKAMRSTSASPLSASRSSSSATSA